MDAAKFDDIFMGMLQHCEQVEPFLDAMFSFLARRTDFFRVMHSRDDKMGFPPGVAEKIVLKIFKKYQELVKGNQTEKKSAGSEKNEIKGSENVSTETSSDQTSSSDNNASSLPSPPTPSVCSTTVEVETSSSEDQAAAPVPLSESTAGASTVSTSSAAQPENSKSSDEGKGLVPGKSSECYNGAVLDRYLWSQTIKDIEVKIPVPSSITKGRDVGVEIKTSHLKVWLKKDISPVTGSNVLVDGKLQRTIKCEDSMWLLEGGKFIIVNLEKREERFWTAVLEGDAEIDKTKVDTTRDISDFDEQTQSDFEHVMYDHRQKLQGKPTSQELKTHELLKQAWNAKGSPFAGTEFDPSKVNISPSYG